MNLDQFKSWALAQGQVGKIQGGFVGQCVSLINQYLYRVYGITAGAWGDAKDWATNANVLKHFDRVSNIQPGDIIVYPKEFGGGYGHIAVALGGGKMLDQNGDGKLRIAIRNVWPGHSAILRRKGTNQGGNNMAQIDDLINQNYQLGVEINNLRQAVADQTKNHEHFKALSIAQAKEIVELKKQVVAGGGTLDQATKDQIAETNSIVKWVKDKIDRIFK